MSVSIALGPAVSERLPPVVRIRLPGRTLSVRVLNVGLACCAVEAMVAAFSELDGGPAETSRPCAGLSGGSAPVEVLVVSGTVTERSGPLLQRLYCLLPTPVRVVSFGACANTGGPYWDSYCVVPGVDTLLPVDVWVPGCPPRPEALIAALAELTP